jgi:hypothetical protein
VLPEPGLLVVLIEGPKSEVPRKAWVPSTSTCVDGRNPLTRGRGWFLPKRHTTAFDPLHNRVFAEQKQTAIGFERRDQSLRFACYLPFELWCLLIAAWLADEEADILRRAGVAPPAPAFGFLLLWSDRDV